MRKLSSLLLAFCLVFLQTPLSVSAQTNDPEAPAGFKLVSETIGVRLYRKDYPGGSPDFVQVVRLDQGAALELMHGEIREPRLGKGVYGGNDPRMTSKTLQNYWDEATARFENEFCVLNGQFFYMPEYPTRLPFPLKVEGNIITDGYAIDEFPGKKLILELWDDRAEINQLTKNNLYTSTAPNIIAGLTENAGKRVKDYTGRTFVGVKDRNGDGRYEIVLIFNTKSARPKDAGNVLRDFGAAEVMMLDGGGSTQLLCEGKSLVYSERLIPQAIAVTSHGELPPPDLNNIDAIGNGGEIAAVPAEIAEEHSTDISRIPGSSEENITPLYAGIRLGDVVWVPVYMSPLMLILFVIIRSIRLSSYQ